MMEQWEGEQEGGPEGALDHLKPGAQVWLSDTEGGKKRIVHFASSYRPSDLLKLVMLKPAVNEAASLQRKRESCVSHLGRRMSQHPGAVELSVWK